MCERCTKLEAALRQIEERIAELDDILDTIRMHGVEREYGWMMVPKVEWEQAFERAGFPKSRPE